jgi:uncharacterized DUF497 family protein
MKLVWDPAKRADTLRERDLDFADAAKLFTGSISIKWMIGVTMVKREF